MIICDHGDPHPARCALCRLREDKKAHPEKYALTTARETWAPGVPRPIWFDAEVEIAREQARRR